MHPILHPFCDESMYTDHSLENHSPCHTENNAWQEEQKLLLLVQIIDEYYGLLTITIGFRGDHAVLKMDKEAECFLEEYSGYATAVLETAD